MTLFLDAACQCGQTVRIVYNPVQDEITHCKCLNCGLEITQQSKERLRHYLDGIVTTFEHSPFAMQQIFVYKE